MKTLGSILLIASALLIGCTGKTPPIANAQPNTSVAVLEKVKLGGLDQWVCIRAQNKHNPILIVVHGGPGGPELGPMRKFCNKLEESFVVVNWDQRGAGKSYSKSITPEQLSIQDFVNDITELTQLTTKRFEQKKVVILAHSWGSVPGLLFAKQHPELVLAYVAVGQVTNRAEQERLSYEYALTQARRQGKEKAVRQLTSIAFSRPGVYEKVEDVVMQRDWLGTFGGVSYDPKFLGAWVGAMLMTPEYSLFDKARVYQGLMFSMRHVFPAFLRVDMTTEVTSLEVPALFVTGETDHITQPSTVAAYAEILQAPEKKVVVMQQAGHLACFEKPAEFISIMEELRGRL